LETNIILGHRLATTQLHAQKKRKEERQPQQDVLGFKLLGAIIQFSQLHFICAQPSAGLFALWIISALHLERFWQTSPGRNKAII